MDHIEADVRYLNRVNELAATPTMILSNDPPRRSLWHRLLDAFKGRDGS